jgi:hypothetical protein
MIEGSAFKMTLTNYGGFVGFFDEKNSCPLQGIFRKRFILESKQKFPMMNNQEVDYPNGQTT